MRKTNFTILSVVMLMLSVTGLRAQECPLSCNDLVNISLDTACKRAIMPADVLNIDPAVLANCDLRVELAYPYPSFYNYLKPNNLDGSLIGYKMVYKVIDNTNENSCWGYIQVEDKFPPQIDCSDDTIHCWEAEVFGAVLIDGNPDGVDNCQYPARTQELSRRWVDFECDSNMFVGKVIRDVVAFDVWGNSKECNNQTLYILRDTITDVVCTDSLVTIDCCQDSLKPYLPPNVSNDKEDLWEGEYVYYDEDGYAHPKVIIGYDGSSTVSYGLVEPPYLDSDGWRGHLGADVVIINGKVASESPADNGKCNIIGHYKDHIIPTCGSIEVAGGPDWVWTYKIRREWKIFDWCTGDDTTCIQWIKIIDTTGPVLDEEKWIKDGHKYQEAFVKAHDCKAHVDLYPPPVLEDCGLKWAKDNPEKALEKMTAYYELQYTDPKHPGKYVVETGSMPLTGHETIYLPDGWYEVKWVVRDPCWNETIDTSYIAVYDRTPPTPVCDEITQVTLDPVNCWARVYAEDLDDGSDDNCKHKLHFAIASKDSIEYYRQKLHDDIVDCYGHYYYEDNKEHLDHKIEAWINCYVFKDYIDLSECGSEMVGLRVYEADHMPIYDPHIFKGSKHQWFCFNLYDDYACFFKAHYDEFAHYGNPRPDICDDIVYDYECDCSDEDCEERPYPASLEHFPNYEEYGSKPYKNEVCCDYMVDSDHPYYQKWKDLQDEYPELPHICDKRYWFSHLYNDCWIEILKDDKVPPVCYAPEDVTAYCDGVPYWVYIDKLTGEVSASDLGTSSTYSYHGVQFAHDVCAESDELRPIGGCKGTNGKVGDACCVEIPWTSEHGYYGGPKDFDHGHGYGYEYSNPCEELYDWYKDGNWQPIYCRNWLILDYFDDPSYGKPDPEDYFGEPVVKENCWDYEIEEETEGALNECGAGVLTRTWVITDKCDNSTVCYQKVYVRPRSDFEVKFPADVSIDCNDGDIDLSATEGGAGYPVITDDECELIGVNYEDERYDIDDEACYKILRTWTIIDWCVYDVDLHHRYPDVIVNDSCCAGEDRPCVIRNLKDDGDGYMTYLQVIKVYDSEAPEVVAAPDTTICIYDENCLDADVEYTLGEATDFCAEADDIQYRYIVNAYGEGEVLIYGHGNVLDETLPVGDHVVYLIARDLCGNEDTAHLELEIVDCKAPTPYCYNGIATVVMPNTNEVTVWAKDLDAGSFDNCTDAENLRFTFSSTPPDEDSTYVEDDKSSWMSFDCSQLGEVTVNIYVWDEEGNYDFCETYLLIQPGIGACQDSQQGLAMIEGEISTEGLEAVEFAEVKLNTENSSIGNFMTGVDGKFVFSGVQMNKSYEISPLRNDDADNGVSTLDLVFIQKHILGIDKLDSPYQLIAADINNSSSITALDIVELRKLILGLYNEFPNNTSWRFVDGAYEFAEPTEPWGFAESRDITMTNSQESADFVGVKIGDVNGTVKAHSLQGATVRNTGSELVFEVEERSVEVGEQVEVSFRSNNFESVSGYQYTLQLSGLEYVEVKSGRLDISSDNFGVHEGMITTSWHSDQGVSSTGELFTMSFVATQSGQLSEMLDISSAITRAEAYSGNTQLGVDIAFVKDGEIVESGLAELYQNTPNPFGSETIVGFTLAQSGEATLKIMDVSGKVLKVYEGDYSKGYNQIKVMKKDLSSAGVLYYQLESGEFVATKKMIVIE